MTPRIFPERIDRTSTKSPAERKLFEVFHSQLGNNFVVFHSVAWLSSEHSSKPVDGETDFVIAHPELGILVLEVKGGFVGFDSARGWYSQRKDGSVVDIKNPFRQAKDAKYSLLRKIRKLPNWPGLIPSLGHAVAFPDGNTNNDFLNPEIDNRIVLFSGNCGDVGKWLYECMDFYRNHNGFTAPGENGIEALIDLLRKSWCLSPTNLVDEIDWENPQIDLYTKEQFRVLDNLSRVRKAAIQGCAGSGKTILAAEKAKRLAKEGFRTLFTCYNNHLIKYIQRLTGNIPRLKITNFHGLCYEYGKKINFQGITGLANKNTEFYSNTLPEALLEAVSLHPEIKFDAVIIDEGQDFESNWFYVLEGVLNDPENGIFYTFFDDNQSLYKREYELPVPTMPIELNINCRNTRKISDAVSKFYKSNIKIEAIGPEGREIKLHQYSSDRDFKIKFTEICSRLVFSEEVDHKQIVVLSPGGIQSPPLSSTNKFGVFKIRESIKDDDPYQIKSATIRKFKGLESDVVLLVIPQKDDFLNEYLYVGLSRARNHVEIIAHDSVVGTIRDNLEK